MNYSYLNRRLLSQRLPLGRAWGNSWLTWAIVDVRLQADVEAGKIALLDTESQKILAHFFRKRKRLEEFLPSPAIGLRTRDVWKFAGLSGIPRKLAFHKNAKRDTLGVFGCPEYDEKAGYELAGFVWLQGFNDLVDGQTYPNENYDEYSRLLSHFIRDVRKDLSAPKMPFVIGVLGSRR